MIRLIEKLFRLSLPPSMRSIRDQYPRAGSRDTRDQPYVISHFRPTGKAHWLIQIIALAALVGLTNGCGRTVDGRVPLSGEVRLVGQPLDRGSIEFHPLGEGVMSGGTVTDGKFEISAEQGVKPGTYQVRVFAAGATTEIDPNEPPGAVDIVPLATERIAPRFNIESQMTVEIGANGNEGLVFEVAGS